MSDFQVNARPNAAHVVSGEVLIDRSRARYCGSMDDLTRIARLVVDMRAKRSRFVKASLFSEPAWDILLEVFAAEGEGRRLSVSSVGLIANIPTTTTLRWIHALEREGLVMREEDPFDRRRSFLSVTDDGYSAVGHCLAPLHAVMLSRDNTPAALKANFR